MGEATHHHDQYLTSLIQDILIEIRTMKMNVGKKGIEIVDLFVFIFMNQL